MPFTHNDKGTGDLIRSADWNEMGREVVRLGGDKVDRAGDTIGALTVRTGLEVGTANAGAPLRIFKRQEDGSALEHGALIVGNDAPTSASLRLGYSGGFSWIQGQGRNALALNPRGGDVGVGTDAPRSRLSVAGGLTVGAGYAASAAAAAGTLLVEGSVGIGTTTPRSALDTGLGVVTGASNDYEKAQFTMTGGGIVSWGGPGGRLKWTARFIVAPLARPTGRAGHININQPTTDLPAAQVYDGAVRSANADGVLLGAWEALYAVHAPGGDPGAVTLRIVFLDRDFQPASNWLLVAAVNGDDGTVRLGTGEIVGRGSTLQRRLDVAENGAATVRAADFNLGHSGRRGTPGRALVDATRQLVVNYGGDWPDGVQVQSNLGVTGILSVTGGLDFGQGIGQRVNLWGTAYGIGMQASTAYFRTENNFAFYRGGVHSGAALDPGAGGSALMTLRISGNVGIGTTEPRARLEVAGAIMPAAGNTDAAGILFPPNPGGGGGDSAWLRYYARTGEATTLEIGVSNDADDNIALISPGGVGIGTRTPRTALDTGMGVLSGAGMDYIQGQFTMTGGGSVSWAGSGGRLKWTNRFIAIPVGRPTTAGGHVNIFQPATDIPAAQVYNGQARSANADGVVLNGWEALYAVHDTGRDQSAVTYRIVHHAFDFHAPSNWLLVAAVNGDDNSVRLGTGKIIAAGRGLPAGSRRAREIVTASNQIFTTVVDWRDVPNMQLGFDAGANPVLLLFKAGGVQINGVANGRARFRMLLDGVQVAFVLYEFHNNGWELRDTTLVHMGTVTPGRHNVTVQWHTESGNLGVCWYNDTRTLMAVEL
jgi:hypothetical protein